MKMHRIFPIVRASVCTAKAKTLSFCMFLTLCTMLTLSVLSLMLPLWHNMEYKVNEHVYNRELTATFQSAGAVEAGLEELEALAHVTDTYQKPVTMSALETSGILYSDYELDYLHKGYTPVITGGRLFKEGEKHVALLPEFIHDFNGAERKRNEIDGKTLLGKELVLQDGFGISHRVKIVGTYNTADPIFNGKQIVVPVETLLSYNAQANQITENQAFSLKETLRYGVCVDSYKNVEEVQENALSVTPTYQEDRLNFDVQTFNTALIILSVILALFLIMVMLGVSLFVSSCLKSRTKELALYRAVGYKTKHLYAIIFSEYFSLAVCSVLLGAGLTMLAGRFIVNPYLDGLLGNTIMAMHLQVDFWCFAMIFIVFSLIVTITCKRAANQSAKIDLMLLIRDGG